MGAAMPMDLPVDPTGPEEPLEGSPTGDETPVAADDLRLEG